MSQRDAPEESRYLGLTATQFNLAFFAVLGAIGLAVFAYLGGLGMVGDALGGGGEPADSTTSEPLTPTPDAPDTTSDPNTVAQAAVLTLDDMPAGWTIDVDDSDDDDEDIDVSPECAVLNELEQPPGQIGYAEADDFEGPEGQLVTNDATVFEDAEAATGAMRLYKDALTRCGEEFLAAFEQALKKNWSEEGQTDIPMESRWDTPTEIAFESESDSYRFILETTVEGVDMTFTFDIYFVRAGQLVGSYMYTAIGEVDTFEEQSVGLTAAEKVRSASASFSP